MMNNFTQIICAFGYASLADSLGISRITVSSWKIRNSIPPQYWMPILTEAKKRDLSLDYEDMARFAAERRKKREAA